MSDPKLDLDMVLTQITPIITGDQFLVIQNAIAEIERLRSGWMPIETAPKDGTKVLFDFGDGIDTGRFEHPDDEKPYRAASLCFDEPLCWMPLPQPPIGGDMKNTLWKLKILLYMLKDPYQQWKGEVWRRNPDEYFCCPGDPMMNQCGCQGVSVRDVFDHDAQA